jgi:predicted permease
MSQLKRALRTLFKAPAVTVVAIVSLALGIGANAAIFSLFDQVLLRDLPVRQPDRLVNLAAPGLKPGSQHASQAGDRDAVFSYPMFRDLERAQGVFTGIAAHRSFAANLTYRRETSHGVGIFVSGSYFPVLGLEPALGRLLGPDHDKTIGTNSVAVVSHAYWVTRLGANPTVLHQTVLVNGQPMTIVGVAPRGFAGTTIGSEPQVFVPITMSAVMPDGYDAFDNRRSYWVYLFARLRPGVSIVQARSGINQHYRALLSDVEAPLQRGMSGQTLDQFKAKQITVEEGRRGQSRLLGASRAPLILLFSTSAVVLLIACANVANLLLARAARRAAEMAVRLSLGASRRQLVAHLLAESCVLAGLGGILGLVVARWTLDLIASLLPAETAAALQFELHFPMVLFAAGLSLGTGLLVGIFPAFQSTRLDLVSTLKTQAGQPSGARAAARFRTSLVTAQVALSMTLLVSAGLFVKSLRNVSLLDLGLPVDNVASFRLSPELNDYDSARNQALFERVEQELSAIPGVTGVAASHVALLSGTSRGSQVLVEGFEATPDTDSSARWNAIGAGYFRTLGIPLLAGREFTPADGLGAPAVAIVNEAFAKKFNLDRDAVGKRMAARGGTTLDIEIVGLARNAKHSEVKLEAPPVFFRPYRQDDGIGAVSFYIRTSLSSEQLLRDISGVIARVDPNLPLQDLKTMRQQVRENVFQDRMIGMLSAAFAVLATLLAAVGLYGVLAYTVAQRTREIGLRMALGADARRVRGMVMRQVGRMILVGGAAGITAALWLGRFARTLLFELDGHDPAVFAAAAALLTVVALGAGYIPARRASRVDPMWALRYE